MINYDKQNRRFANLEREKQEALAAERKARHEAVAAAERTRDEALTRAEKADIERKRLYSILDGIMHETRRLNAEVASACEDISSSIAKLNFDQARMDAGDAFYTSGLISSRLTFADFEINPDSITRQLKYSAGVYKKFDKARRALHRSAQRKSINIVLNGPSRNEIEVLPAFEMVPFVLLDNAVKYSPTNQDVKIDVSDNPSPGYRVEVNVSSIGPMVPADEIDRLLERGIRGQQAINSKIPGEGIGLYLANTLTRLANGRITIASSNHCRYTLNGIGYSDFFVNILFKS